MTAIFEDIMRGMFQGDNALFDADELFQDGDAGIQSLTAAFLLSLAGDETSAKWLRKSAVSDELAAFFLDAFSSVEDEIDAASDNPHMRERLERLARNPCDRKERRNLFFPEGADLPENREERAARLRESRRVEITQPNPKPITSPGQEMIFTSNVLLTIPDPDTDLEKLPYSPELRRHIREAVDEEQLFWYDHPIQIGVEPQANEILYGLRGLDEAVDFERERGNMIGIKIDVVLSVSVTHNALRGLAKEYIETEIRNAGGFGNLNVYVFTESDTQRIIREVLVPLGGDAELLNIFGVNGEYGRHYSFLKAISALWQAVQEPRIKGTFKIDLDQVFPQRELVEQTGASAFEHFTTPLWGARGGDVDGNPLELGMIAGALVNERDIERGVFTPDVTFPAKSPSIEDEIFYSKLTMALSTEGELMTRYGENGIDGRRSCIQRIHVTGGTNGILVDSLRRHRPFTPSFIGRAEDQCYILSVLREEGDKLRYLHKDGLIMRHDKEAFAASAIRAASFGNIIGDYIRTLYFSEYARVISGNSLYEVKSVVDPFTGCFITPIPVTVVMLRFCAKAAEFFLNGQTDRGCEFVEGSCRRLKQAMQFAQSDLREQYRRERQGWDMFYDLVDELEKDETLRVHARTVLEKSLVVEIDKDSAFPAISEPG